MPRDPDTLMRMVYLLVLLVGVGGFFLWGRRGRLGRSLRDLAIWALILAMAVIAYGFRDVLREELLPSAMLQVAPGTIELRRARDGHFHAELEVNGEPVRFMIDTGASEIVLSLRDAQRVGLDPGALTYAGRAITANGPVGTAAVRLGTVRFGDFTDTGVPA
ncbi:MAG TPA: TIGR02281 family clan AA aspartic protease, partial [Amaricoccus sp.]|nr:TIGR02281 family clan AA aspartic protease [Amaricoccus sp.]